jgi:hypothetical protein
MCLGIFDASVNEDGAEVLSKFYYIILSNGIESRTIRSLISDLLYSSSSNSNSSSNNNNNKVF